MNNYGNELQVSTLKATAVCGPKHYRRLTPFLNYIFHSISRNHSKTCTKIPSLYLYILISYVCHSSKCSTLNSFLSIPPKLIPHREQAF
jgi:hypothetical protein